ncbi:MAG: NAD(P)/FAD-dependent oxidoreductase [Armatimonadaceae bacterium]
MINPVKRPSVIIIGGGFGGLAAARALQSTPVDITLIDRTNHHVFQPLLYQVATGGLSPTEISAPIRTILKDQQNVKVIMADVIAVDRSAKQVKLAHGMPLSYDYLIVATGGRHHYFGHPEWEALAPGLKTLEDASRARERFLGAFEAAEQAESAAERQEWLTFVVVGGGPTGCELAGVLPEIARKALAGEYRSFKSTDTRIYLIENSAHVLDNFPDDLRVCATADLKHLGVDVIPLRKAADIQPDHVMLDDGTRIPCRTVFWAAGNKAGPICSTLGAEQDRTGRVIVTPHLHLPDDTSVYVIGDAAHVRWQEDSTVPGVAPAARQMGECAGRNIAKLIRGDSHLSPFCYKDKGSMAVLGRNKAIVAAGKLHVHGVVAWLMWLFVHILYLAGYRNRLLVLLEWAYAYVTYRRGVRYLLKERTE